eukprot:CAMPEP_0119105570 /NCGR_PEP_ID=MMETSP1180-20130426/3494_1 /TAXON_ID=3052 ORGANISM="Chlamydomonas cf sp, Strain CCMP681" /NCGR_SAMPLE_ID=MMETSP1180 /ASSEMBLY_ACC=CAM_ASM_000741 /LENGTH=43 /DNA_ID= /DNA_START= /DNA_END= /DNA_ORIENTATION=
MTMGYRDITEAGVRHQAKASYLGTTYNFNRIDPTRHSAKVHST